MSCEGRDIESMNLGQLRSLRREHLRNMSSMLILGSFCANVDLEAFRKELTAARGLNEEIDLRLSPAIIPKVILEAELSI